MIAVRALQLITIAAMTSFGCTNTAETPKPIEIAKPAAMAKPTEGQFDKDLLKIAAEYKTWGRVDDNYRWAPQLCIGGPPGQVAFSSSKDANTHGQKLYSLFARHRNNYVGESKDKSVPADQVIVKQSWVPQEITESNEKPSRVRANEKDVISTKNSIQIGDKESISYDSFYPYIWDGDRVYKASKQADLFIMMKLDPKTPGTDEGWVYATVTPDGKKVTAAGRIESCMKCHQEAKHDRLFGLK